jgi:hypothetical protein
MVEVDGASEQDIERMTYEEQLDSLKSGVKLLVAGATNAIIVSGPGGCLHEDTELMIVRQPHEAVTKLKTIKDSAIEKYGVLTNDKFYDISYLGLKIKSPTGTHNLISLIKKIGKNTHIEFSDGSKIQCSDRHYINTSAGSYMACDLKLTDEVITVGGVTKAINIDISDIDHEFYDVEVESEDGLYYTANGISHHNTGKTQNVEDTLSSLGKSDGKGYFKVSGSISAPGLYRLLFEHKNEIILADDADNMFIDQESRNLLKAAADTKKIRKISWMKGGGNYIDPDEYDEDADDGKLPRHFEFSGKLIVISNLKLDQLDKDGAFRTRAYIIDIDPTNIELLDFMKRIVDKIVLDVNHPLSRAERMEVIEVLESRGPSVKVNLRQLVRGLNTRAGIEQQGGTSEEWRKFVKRYA